MQCLIQILDLGSSGFYAGEAIHERLYFAPAKTAQIGVLEQLTDKQLHEAVLLQVVKGRLMLQKYLQHLIVDPDVFHECQLADQIGYSVETIQICYDVGET